MVDDALENDSTRVPGDRRETAARESRDEGTTGPKKRDHLSDSATIAREIANGLGGARLADGEPCICWPPFPPSVSSSTMHRYVTGLKPCSKAGDCVSRHRQSDLHLTRGRLQSLHRPGAVHRDCRMEPFELQRRRVAQRRMPAPRVVPPLDELEDGRPRLSVRGKSRGGPAARTRASRRSSRPLRSSKPQNAPGAVEAPQILSHPPVPSAPGATAFPFVVSKSLWGEDWVTVQRPDGTVWSIPVGWTDFATPDPAVVAGRGRAPYRLEDLLRLAEMVSERVRT